MGDKSENLLRIILWYCACLLPGVVKICYWGYFSTRDENFQSAIALCQDSGVTPEKDDIVSNIGHAKICDDRAFHFRYLVCTGTISRIYCSEEVHHGISKNHE